MVTGMLAVKNLTAGEHHDLWSVNTDQEYHEEIVVESAIAGAFAEAFAKIDRLAFGLSTGTTAGLLLFFSTLFLVAKGGDTVGPNLQLLGEYFPWYKVTLVGSFLGLFYGFLTGFAGGWGFAFLRNLFVFLYTALLQRRAERLLLRKFLEYV
jgi:hypothetical protein